MKLTVEKLLKLQAYKDSILVGGSKGLLNEVSGITIMEDTTINEWLRGGEALLTSLIPLKDYSDDEMINFFNNLLAKRVSAIIIKKGKVYDSVPKELISWGNKNCVPIIQVPRHLFYTDLMYPVMAEVMENQVNRLSYFKSIHEKFREMAIKDYPLKVVLETISEIIGNPVSIYDKNYNLMLTTLKNAKDITKNRNFKQSISNKTQVFSEIRIDDKDEKVKEWIFEVSALENTKSYLVIIEMNKVVDDMDLLAIENACTNIALIMAKNIAIKEVEERFMNNIVDDLIFGLPKISSSLLERANIAGIDLYAPYIILVLKLNCKLDIIKFSLKKYLGDFVKKHNGVYSLKNDYVVLFINTINNGKNDSITTMEIKEEIKSISEEMGSYKSNRCFSTGIGTIANGFAEIKKSYEEAMNTIIIGEDIYNQGFVLSYEELGIYKIITDISKDSDITKYMPKSMLKLMEIDKLKNKELMNTLEVYIKNNQHINLTADELFIHPKTVSYRLEQIKELVGIDIKNADSLLEIQFAIKILKYLEKQPS
ncbi:MAG: PucR family transcriptional regulator ligand-binding domain-containing protein [Gudongella sp.]|nr:PucR family transcriptional regulator ligand-binding domain-containing protein [Gudongella sp.]